MKLVNDDDAGTSTEGTDDAQGAQEEAYEQRLVDLVGQGEAAARVERFYPTPDTENEDRWRIEMTLRFDLKTLDEIKALVPAFGRGVIDKFRRGKNPDSVEKLGEWRKADDKLKATIWGVSFSATMPEAKFRTSKVETVLTCKLTASGFTLEEITAMHKEDAAGGLAEFAFAHAQQDLFTQYRVNDEGELPPEA